MSALATTGNPTDGLAPVRWDELDAERRSRLLERPRTSINAQQARQVSAILDDVRQRGDLALRELTLRFDKLALDDFAVALDDFEAAADQVDETLKQAIVDAAGRIEKFHSAAMDARSIAIDTARGVRCESVTRAIGSVGLYVPAGSAPLISTVLMLAVPSLLAGCPERIICTPADSSGRINPALLFAAQLCGIERIYRVGGAQAIAAMAYGTGTIPRCAKIFGPGNSWVTTAKQQVAADGCGVAIDMPAGPSEVLVIADAGARPEFVAADLLSQAEHGPDSQVLLLSDSDELLGAVAAQVESQLKTLPRADIARQSLASSRLVLVTDIETAITISNRYAPEHLILALREPRRWLTKVTDAGSVFLGDWAAESLGDYCSGTNHVLPTAGAARAFSGVSVASFQRRISVQTVTARGMREIGPCAATLARAEGLEAHAQAVDRRLRYAMEEAIV